MEFKRFLKDILTYHKFKKSVILLQPMEAFETFIEQLKKRLQKPLPGLEIQLRLAPITRLNELKKIKSPDDAQQSAVLALLYPQNGNVGLLIIKRAVDDTVHSGQISFPGGKREKSDTDLRETALRETFEEIGISSTDISIIGSLSKLYIPPSNFDVYPFVGYISSEPELNINYEVEKVIKVSLNELTHKDAIQYKTINGRDGQFYEVPCYFVQGEIIWGATAMMLSELISIVND